MPAKAKAKRIPTAEKVTAKVIDRMEADNLLPWSSQWYGQDLGTYTIIPMPRNFETGKAYKGGNTFTLLGECRKSIWWMTFKQALRMAVKHARANGRSISERKVTRKTKAGKSYTKVTFWDDDADAPFRGGVRKKEKGTLLVKWIFTWLDADGKEVPEGDPRAVKKTAYMGEFHVFNQEQIDGVDFPAPAPPKKEEVEKRKVAAIAAAEKVIEGYKNPPTLSIMARRAGQSPCYSPPRDTVEMPLMEQFKDAASFYKVLFHEFIHSTGSKDRLARAGIVDFDSFGSDQYAAEELIAELGACFLSMVTGCWGEAQLDNSAAYIKGWSTKLKDDPKLYTRASGLAQKAAEHILGCPLDEWTPDAA